MQLPDLLYLGRGLLLRAPELLPQGHSLHLELADLVRKGLEAGGEGALRRLELLQLAPGLNLLVIQLVDLSVSLLNILASIFVSVLL